MISEGFAYNQEGGFSIFSVTFGKSNFNITIVADTKLSRNIILVGTVSVENGKKICGFSSVTSK